MTRLRHHHRSNNAWLDPDGKRSNTTAPSSERSTSKHKQPGRKRRKCVRALRPFCGAVLHKGFHRKLAADDLKHRTMAAVASNIKAIKAIQKQLATASSSSSSRSCPARAAVDLFLQLPDVRQHSAEYLDAILRAGYRHESISLTDALRFLRGLPNPEHQLNGCWLLHEVDAAAAGNEHRQVRLALAFFVCEIKQKLQNSPLKIRVDQFWRDWYTPGVRALVLGHSVAIEAFARASTVPCTCNSSSISSSSSSDSDDDDVTDVLCASSDALKFDDLRRRVFVCKRRAVECVDSDSSTAATDAIAAVSITDAPHDSDDVLASQWRFVPGNADKTWFHIVNARYATEYLYAAAVRVDDAQSVAKDYAFMWCGGAPDAQCEWELRFCGGRDVFELYNPDRRAFLFASRDQRLDSERRLALALDAADATDVQADARQWRFTT